MNVENGFILDLFPPVSWEEDDIVTALEIQEVADADQEQDWAFTAEEMRYLAKCIRYYIQEVPREDWGERFKIDTEIDINDPNETGRFIIDLVFPEHLEAPETLR